MRSKKYLAGFTLIEILVVIFIISILMSISMVSIASVQRKSRDSGRKADILTMQTSMASFYSDFKVYPNYTYFIEKPIPDTGEPTVGVIETFVGSSYFYDPPAEGQTNEISDCRVSGNLPGGFYGDSSSSFNNRNGGNGFAYLDSSISGYVNDHSGDSGGTYNTDYIKTLKPGFQFIGMFLNCTGYLDKTLSDKSFTLVDNYQYRVSYDYNNYILSALLENQSDKDIDKTAVVNNGCDNTGKCRFAQGNGKTTDQFANDSTDPGKYVYQINTGNLDDRTLEANKPTSSTTCTTSGFSCVKSNTTGS